ncbi:MAG: PTS sugar transporter subunit IIB [Brevinema sp.]
MHILTVCGVGMGNSLILRISVENILKELGINSIKVELTDETSVSSIKTDLIITAKEFADILKTKTHSPIAIINNYADKEGVRKLLIDWLS